MIPYMLLISIPALFMFVAPDRTSGSLKIRIGSPFDEFIKKHNLVIPVFFIAFMLLLMLRDESIGRDLPNYKMYFEIYPRQSMQYYDLFRSESLFRLYNWLIGQFTDNFQIYLAITSFLTVLPFALLYRRERQFGYMQIIVFVGMSTFVVMFSAIRQIMAMAIGVLAYHFVKEKKWVAYLLCVVIAFGFHHSAFMLLFYYPLYHVTFKKKHLWIIVPVVGIVFFFNRPIFNLINIALMDYDEKYTVPMTSTGAYMSLILFVLFAVFCYLIPDESKMDREVIGLRNFLLMAVLLQCFSPLHTLAMRLNYYFIIFIPIVLAKVLTIPSRPFAAVAKWGHVIITVYFTFDFVYKTYISAITGVSALDTIPYVPFWA